MPLQNQVTDAAVFANAEILAVASDIAYCDQATGEQRFKDELGFAKANLYSVGNTQGWLTQTDDYLVLVFRGSERPTSLDGLRDWLLTNANNFLIVPEGRMGTDFGAAGVGARFHRGFIAALGDIWEPVLAAVSQAMEEKERPLFVSGHSLGGALALLAAWKLQKNFIAVEQVYTFGAPMVGNDAAAAAFDREFEGKVFRFVGDPDLVPRLPTVSLVANSYRHCQREFILGAAAVAAAASSVGVLTSLAGTVGDAFNEGVMDSIWKQLNDRLAAHDIIQYKTLIAARGKELG